MRKLSVFLFVTIMLMAVPSASHAAPAKSTCSVDLEVRIDRAANGVIPFTSEYSLKNSMVSRHLHSRLATVELCAGERIKFNDVIYTPAGKKIQKARVAARRLGRAINLSPAYNGCYEQANVNSPVTYIYSGTWYVKGTAFVSCNSANPQLGQRTCVDRLNLDNSVINDLVCNPPSGYSWSYGAQQFHLLSNATVCVKPGYYRNRGYGAAYNGGGFSTAVEAGTWHNSNSICA